MTFYFVRTNSARCVFKSIYNVPVLITIFRTENPFRMVIIPSLLSFCDCFVAFLPIITLPVKPLDGCFVVNPPPPPCTLPNTCVSTPFNNSAVPALLRVWALLVIPNALRFVGDNDADVKNAGDDVDDPGGGGVWRRWTEFCFNDDFNGLDGFFLGTDFAVVGCMDVVFDDTDVILTLLLLLVLVINGSVSGCDVVVVVVVAVVVSTVLVSLLLLLLLVLLLLLLLQLTWWCISLDATIDSSRCCDGDDGAISTDMPTSLGESSIKTISDSFV